MKYIDLHKKNSSAKKQIRRQVVRLKEMGKTGKEIEEAVYEAIASVKSGRRIKAKERHH